MPEMEEKILSQNVQSKPESSIYQPLDPSRKEIRLIRLFPWKKASDFTCTIEQVSLENDVEYLALSYTWGQIHPTESVMVNDLEVPVTSNAKAALKRWTRNLKQSRMPQLIWVDVLCINQQDEEEKESQIKMMKEIYSRGFATIAWLGEAGSDDERFKVMDNLISFAEKNDLKSLDFDDLKPDGPEYFRTCDLVRPLSIGFDGSVDIALLPLAMFYQNPWWLRVWTFEEVALAKKVLISWGPNQITPIGLIDVYKVLRAKQETLKIQKSADDLVTTLLVITRISLAAFTQMQISGVKPSGFTLLEMLDMVNTGARHCYKPRDCFFGVLGLVDGECAEMQHLHNITYQQDTIQIFVCVAQALLRTYGLAMLEYCYGENLGISSHPILHSEEINRAVSGLPSWTPDWHRGSISPLQGRLSSRKDRHLYDASRQVVAASDIQFEGFALTCTGVLLDMLQGEIMEMPPETNTSLSPEEWVIICLIPWMHKASNLLGKSKKYGYHAGLDMVDMVAVAEAIFLTVTADRLPLTVGTETHVRISAEEVHSICSTLFVPLMNDRFETETVKKTWPDVGKYRTTMLHMSPHWRLFVTKKGYIGLGRSGCEPGDIVCLLPGANCPFVLHPLDGDQGRHKYRLVGEAYVHGIMDGEYKPSTPEYQTFTIL